MSRFCCIFETCSIWWAEPKVLQYEFNMTPKSTVSPAKSRRGLARHTTNPFLASASDNTKDGKRRVTNKAGDHAMLVSSNTGEVVASGFWHTQEVDRTQFVKLYVNGVKAFKELTPAGTKVFEILYLTVQQNIGKGEVWLALSEVNQDITPISRPIFMRGMTELLLKGFIAESMTQNKYFLNPDYMWNGDRLAFVKEYRLVASKSVLKDDRTQDMFSTLDLPTPDASPNEE